MNELFRDVFLARIAAAIAEARSVSAIPHQGVKGQVREILIRELFQPLLPADLGVGHGHIVSSVEGKVSRERDVIIYDRRLVPPVLYERSLGLFPLECTLAAIEVKSCLTRDELRDADAKAADLFDFRYQSGMAADKLPPGGVSVERLIDALFALDTDLVEGGTTEIQRYQSMPERHPEALRKICVVGRGYWYRWEGDWRSTAPSFDFAEVAAFIAGILGVLGRVAASRRVPSLANYLFEDDEMHRTAAV
jgi:hypothetical protein